MYVQREPLASATQDRVISILTVQNLGGAAGGGAVVWFLCNVLGLRGEALTPLWFLQVLLILIGCGIGIVLTVRWTGLSLFDRASLYLMFQLRKASGGHIIAPPPVLTRAAGAVGVMTLRSDDGVVIARPYTPDQPGDEVGYA